MNSHVVAGSSRYALATNELAGLVADLRKQYSVSFESASKRDDPLCVVRLDANDRLSNLARVQEQSVFSHDLGTNHTPELMAKEYGPYEKDSVFYLVFDTRENRVIGVSRAIFGTGNRPPKVVDLVCDNSDCARRIQKEHDAELTVGFVRDFHGIGRTDGVLDFATLAVSGDARRWSRSTSQLQPSVLLYAAMVRDSYFGRGDVFGSGEATIDLLKFLKGLVGLPAVPIAGLPPFAAFDGDEILSSPFIFEWEHWAGDHDGSGEPRTELGRRIYTLAEGSVGYDPILFANP